MSRRINALVDQEVCIGNAMCRATAPAVFVRTETGQSTVADPSAEPFEAIMEAAELCPVGAITLEDADG